MKITQIVWNRYQLIIKTYQTKYLSVNAFSHASFTKSLAYQVYTNIVSSSLINYWAATKRENPCDMCEHQRWTPSFEDVLAQLNLLWPINRSFWHHMRLKRTAKPDQTVRMQGQNLHCVRRKATGAFPVWRILFIPTGRFREECFVWEEYNSNFTQRRATAARSMDILWYNDSYTLIRLLWCM